MDAVLKGKNAEAVMLEKALEGRRGVEQSLQDRLAGD
jgi:hypothetical protein